MLLTFWLTSCHFLSETSEAHKAPQEQNADEILESILKQQEHNKGSYSRFYKANARSGFSSTKDTSLDIANVHSYLKIWTDTNGIMRHIYFSANDYLSLEQIQVSYTADNRGNIRLINSKAIMKGCLSHNDFSTEKIVVKYDLKGHLSATDTLFNNPDDYTAVKNDCVNEFNYKLPLSTNVSDLKKLLLNN